MNVRISYILLVMLFLIALSSTNALAQVCCVKPNSETTAVAGTSSTTITEFNQTIYDSSGFNFDLKWVEEGKGATGSDTCHFATSIYAPFTTVTGGEWMVAEDDVPGQHNHWGYDYVGRFAAVVTYYRVQAPAHGIPLPCTATIWQSMSFYCGSTWVPYTSGSGNKLTVTIYATTVQNCRNDMSNAACQTISH